MLKVSKENPQRSEDHGPVAEWTGSGDGYTVNFVLFRTEMDHTPLFKGLPGGACQCPHWGYVLKGRISWRFGENVEVVEAGDAFYAPPGHVPTVAEGTEWVQFSPTDELRVTEEVIMRNLAAMNGGTR